MCIFGIVCNFVVVVYSLFLLLLCLLCLLCLLFPFPFFFLCVEGELAANPSPHAHVRKSHQNRGPTASGVGNSESTQKTV